MCPPAPESDLSRAIRHVEEGSARLARQRECIQRLKRLGCDTTLAEALLATLEDSQALHVAGRNQLRADRDR
jgi:hypothetical protein